MTAQQDGPGFDSEEMRRHIERDFWDWGEIIMSLGILSDFEGFASLGPIEDMMQTEEVQNVLDLYKDTLTNVPRDALRDLAYHWLFENRDQGDWEPTVDETIAAIHVMAFVVSSRWRMKTGSNA